jgi:hypothetical protein
MQFNFQYGLIKILKYCPEMISLLAWVKQALSDKSPNAAVLAVHHAGREVSSCLSYVATLTESTSINSLSPLVK